MGRSKEFRVAVGSPFAPRSTVWKFLTQTNEIYILSRMFRRDIKVSLHSSGEGRWAATDDWVKKKPGRLNADRLIANWQMREPSVGEASHVFRVQIPTSELRNSVVADEDLSNVHWLEAAQPDYAVSLECYIASTQSSVDPALGAALPVLFRLPLANGRWLEVFRRDMPLEGFDICGARAEVCARARAIGIEALPQERACVLDVNANGIRGLIELCPLG
jgi:hypothetical protein